MALIHQHTEPTSPPLMKPLLGAAALLVGLTVFLTWPQALYLGSRVAEHDDPFLSMWRLAWIAHALGGDVRHLFDGNIFHPHPRTLAFSDATLLEGLLAAPWLWAGANPVLVYNLLLLIGIVTSGVGMFVLVRSLTGNGRAALVSAAIFTLVPYRIEHVMHLELQWTAWMPLTLWAVHRAFNDASLRFGLLTGVLVSLQVLSCLYYGAYLGIIVAVLVVFMAVSRPVLITRALAPLFLGAVIPAAVAAAYAQPYIENARVLGTRDPGEISRFSAQLSSYVSAPEVNWLWGWTALPFEGNEGHLFPGLVAVALSIAALARHPNRRLVWMYLGVTVVAAELSLGFNGRLYRWLYDHVWLFQGFRAPARFAILACCGLAVLSGLGFVRLEQLISASRRNTLLAGLLIAVALESGSAPMRLSKVDTEVPDIYKFLKIVHPSVILELPAEESGLNSVYMFWSAQHWNSLVNGYSGYAPRDYNETMTRLRTLPDAAAIARLRQLRVRYVVLHESFYKAVDRTTLLLKLAQSPDLIPSGRFRGWAGTAHLFEVRSSGASVSTPREVAR
jgi:hypothetical protein